MEPAAVGYAYVPRDDSQRQPELELGEDGVAADDIGQAFAMLQSIKSTLKCPICLDRLLDPIGIPCNHLFCQDCIRNVSQEADGRWGIIVSSTIGCVRY